MDELSGAVAFEQLGWSIEWCGLLGQADNSDDYKVRSITGQGCGGSNSPEGFVNVVRFFAGSVLRFGWMRVTK